MPSPRPEQIQKQVDENLKGVFAGSENALPMTHPKSKDFTGGPVSARERAEYVQRKQLYSAELRKRQPPQKYEERFNRPTNETIEKIWKRLECYLPKDIESGETGIPIKYIRTKAGQLERDELIKVSKQALIITLDMFVAHGEDGKLPTYNDVFDTLCRGYSDRYHDDDFLAKSARDMSKWSAYQCRRDMLINGVDVNNIWKFIEAWSKGKLRPQENPLFTLSDRISLDERKRGIKTRMKVELRYLEEGNEILEYFKESLIEDPRYRRSQPRNLRVWFADMDMESKPISPVQYEVCHDLKYNEVILGPHSERLLEIQSDARILFDVSAFRADYSEALERMAKIRDELIRNYEFDPKPLESDGGSRKRRPSKESRLARLLENGALEDDDARTFFESLDEYDRTRRFSETFKHVNADIKDREGTHAIRSAFHRTTNRRYQPEHFWPVYVSKRDDEKLVDDDHDPEHLPADDNYRKRWFKAKDHEGKDCDLKGLDVSSSQVQIIAALIGIDELESKSMGESGEAFKKFLAESIWNKHQSENEQFSLNSPEEALIKLREREEQLKEQGRYDDAAKIRLGRYQLKAGYGSASDGRLVDLVKHFMLRTIYGGNLQEMVRDLRDDPDVFGPGLDKNRADEFQKYLFSEFPALEDFLKACREIAKNKLISQGAEFTDPLDGPGHRFVWNPVHREDEPYGNGDANLLIRSPVRWQTKPKYYPSGDYLFLVNNNEDTRLYTKTLSASLQQKFNCKVNVTRIGKKRWLVIANKKDYLAIQEESSIKVYPATKKTEVRHSRIKEDSLPVDKRKLRSMIAPCLVQVLDAYYSSVVMRKLHERGITSFVGIHDCWMVPETVQTVVGGETKISKGLDVLKEVMFEADDEWYDGLGPVYDDLLSYLGDDGDYRKLISSARDKWERRKGKGSPPHFRAFEE